MNETTQNSPATPLGSGALLVGAALAGGLLLSQSNVARAVSPPLSFDDQIFGTGDTKVLNYALSLEALEADLYKQALQRLTTGGVNGVGKTITGLNLSDSNIAIQYLRDFGQIEIAHQAFYQRALGANAITAPGKPLANAKFDFGFDDNNRATFGFVMEQVRVAEALGVNAYIGAIEEFQTTTFLQTASAILGTEARHTAVVTAIINQLGINASGMPSPLPVAPVVGQGTGLERQGIDVPKTPNEVLAIVSPFIVL